MHIRQLDIKNFRLLQNVQLVLEPQSTVIVGRNNCGKTAVAELFRRLLSEGLPIFKLEDFSLGVHDHFWKAFSSKTEGKPEIDVKAALPYIEVSFTVKYETTDATLGALSQFIVDLDQNCFDAQFIVRYELELGGVEAFFADLDAIPESTEEYQKEVFFKSIRDRIPKHYKATLTAQDPNDPTNMRQLSWNALHQLVRSGFISAQRELDDNSQRENEVLGRVFEALFNTANSSYAGTADRTSVLTLEAAVLGSQTELDKHFNDQLTSLLPAFSLFGYPGLPDPKLRTETTLDVARLLKNHTRISYTGANGIHLPEAYNGLGARNLILILLRLLEFFKSYVATQAETGIQLVFIEEPEAHLHPQMQEVFISKLSEIAAMFAKQFNNDKPWPVQFVVSTHSPHMANRAPFSAIRYFLASPEVAGAPHFTTRVKDLSQGFTGVSKTDEKWLHQYMTLTRCDLLFADKVILIEGTSERLLLPKMIEKVDSSPTSAFTLSSQYLSVLEVGGAYAHLFFPLLDFLELRALVVTDLDAIDANRNRSACKVSVGTGTSNACLHKWFGDAAITPAALIAKTDAEKTHGIRRIAYQSPEAAARPTGRSLEAAFMLANPTLFSLDGSNFQADEDRVWELAGGVKKSEFALHYAITEPEWAVPKYIEEGLIWLAKLPVEVKIVADQLMDGGQTAVVIATAVGVPNA
jgi:putative ATP-dependent endonuclease of OLD family